MHSLKRSRLVLNEAFDEAFFWRFVPPSQNVYSGLGGNQTWVLYKNMQTSCSIENLKIPAASLVYFPMLQLRLTIFVMMLQGWVMS